MPAAPAPHVVVVIPALNEAMVIGEVVRQLLALRRGNAPLITEVLVCDNGSSDGTRERALSAGATVVAAPQRGYGAACLAGLAHIATRRPKPDVVLFADGDGSVVAEEAHALIEKIEAGYDLVIGVRTRARQERGALTPPQRVGNLVASLLIFALWRRKVSDLGPFRAVRTESLWRLGMQDRSFGWTVEMQVKALQAQMKIGEVSVSTKRRVGVSKISGTLAGVVGAARGIIGMILRLKWAERTRAEPSVMAATRQR